MHFHSRKCIWKMSSEKRRPSWLNLNVLTHLHVVFINTLIRHIYCAVNELVEPNTINPLEAVSYHLNRHNVYKRILASSILSESWPILSFLLTTTPLIDRWQCHVFKIHWSNLIILILSLILYGIQIVRFALNTNIIGFHDKLCSARPFTSRFI